MHVLPSDRHALVIPDAQVSLSPHAPSHAARRHVIASAAAIVDRLRMSNLSRRAVSERVNSSCAARSAARFLVKRVLELGADGDEALPQEISAGCKVVATCFFLALPCSIETARRRGLA